MPKIVPDKCKDNSEISTYKECPRKHFIRYVLGWRREGNSPALAFGASYHAGLDKLWKHAKEYTPHDLTQLAHNAFLKEWEEQGFDPSMDLAAQDSLLPRTPGIAKEMYFNYIQARQRMLRSADLISYEQPFAILLPESKDMWYIGKWDKVVCYEGRVTILEHKTTTAYSIKLGFLQTYIDSWNSSPQVKGYEFAGTLYYGDVAGVWVDANLVHKKQHDIFKFIPVHHGEAILKEWVYDTKRWMEEIIKEEEVFKGAGELMPGMFRKNEDSCFGKYGPCPFLDICRSITDPSKLLGPPSGYIEDRWEPFDKLGLADKINKGEEV